MPSVDQLRTRLEPLADPERAARSRRYMRDQFAFLGIAMPALRRAARPFVARGTTLSPHQLLATTDELWRQPEREFQYVGVDLLRTGQPRLAGEHLGRIEHYIRHKSWWDTIDPIATHVVGGIVAGDRARLAAVMDRWIDDPDIWIARTAILHQLGDGADTDAEQLFDHVDRRSADTEFFIRKACGWALRQYARHDPDAVRTYVMSRGDQLSPLTRREAMKHV